MCCLRPDIRSRRLQWGRGFVAAETPERGDWGDWYEWLQWGRGFVAAETMSPGPIWPRIWGFNGAAAL